MTRAGISGGHEPPQESRLCAADGLHLHLRRWRPTSAPAATVLIAHGFAEHGGRYATLASRLTDSGYAVVAADHRGHGLSGGKRRSVARFQQYVDDLDTVVRDVRSPDAHVPLVLLGHSMGGLIALAYATQHADNLAGLVLSAPAVLPGRVSSARRAVGRVLSQVAPDLGVLRLPLHRISRDRAIVTAYRNDPLVCAGPLRARLGAEMIDTMRTVDAALPSLRVPLLAMQGTADGLVEPGAARHVVERAGSADRTLHEYPGLWHEIFNEPERELVLSDLVAWLDARWRPRSDSNRRSPP
jgi:acylglycerol lipase